MLLILPLVVLDIVCSIDGLLLCFYSFLLWLVFEKLMHADMDCAEPYQLGTIDASTQVPD